MELVDKITLLKEELELENKVLKKNIKRKKEENKELEKRNDFIMQENRELRDKLEQILYSRSYKFLQKCKKLIKRG